MRVPGIGRCPSPRAIVGEGPGWQEDRAGEPFVGKTGDELDRHLELNDLPDRPEWWLTNIFRFYQGKDYVWTQEDLDRDIPDLTRELNRVRPKLIVALGRYATRHFLGDVDMDATEMLPWFLPETFDRSNASWANESTVIFPITHPAAGFHNPDQSARTTVGFQELKRYLDGEITPRKLFDDPIPNPVYEEITSVFRLQQILQRLTPGSYVSVDTEGWPWLPWSLQFSLEPGTGYVVRKGADRILAEFERCCRDRGARLVFHSALHDLGMGRPLGISFDDIPFDDTMVMAYLLQIVPKGLKQSCLRECGMRMDDFTDLVAAPDRRLALTYLTNLWDLEEADYEQRQLALFQERKSEVWTDKRGKVHHGRRITKLPSVPKTPLHRAVARCLQSKRPRQLWSDQVDDVLVAGYRRMGPIPEATLDHVPRRRAVCYGARDADGTFRLRDRYAARIDALGLRETYDLELGTYPLLNRMQLVGMRPDLAHFAQLSDALAIECDNIQQRIAAFTGRSDFNANSGDQVDDYLQGVLRIEPLKLTRGGRGSTNDKILEALEHEHPELPILYRDEEKGYTIISMFRYFRETYKLKHTFVDQLPDFVQRWPFDGRIHTTLRTTSVVTGRLAASDPNVLAQPEHGKWAPDFKRGWICDPGHILWAGDQSQIELRGLAHLSQDPLMLAIFRGERRNPDGSLVDLHAALAERIFGVKPKDQDKHKHRLPAKAINFGIPMGMTAKGLSVELRKNGVDADEDTAQRWLDETLGLYTGVRAYMDTRIAEAERNGFVRCLSGRIRYIGGIRSRDERVRAEAERFAFSTPIQESAQFIMKQAEINVWALIQDYWRHGTYVEPLIQIHDCLKLEVQDGVQNELNARMHVAMTQVPKTFSVPLAVESECGYNMADMEAFK